MKKQITILSAVSLLFGGIFAYTFAGTGDSLDGATSVNYSGRITKNDDTAINGEYAMRFSIWNDVDSTIDEAKNMTNALWSKTKTVKIQNGAYSVNLDGLSDNIYRPSAADDTERFVQVEVCNQSNIADCDENNSAHWEAIDADPSDAGDVDRDALSGSFFAMNSQLLDGLLPSNFLMYTDEANTELTMAGKLTANDISIGGVEFPDQAGGHGHRLTINPNGEVIWGSGYVIEDGQAKYDSNCGSESEGVIRYNKSLKLVEYCTSDGKWTQMEVGKIPTVSSTILVSNGGLNHLMVGHSEDIDLNLTFDANTNVSEINLDSPEHPITFVNGAGCSVASVSGAGNARTVKITGCDVSTAKNITVHIPGGSALSDTKNPMRAHDINLGITENNAAWVIDANVATCRESGSVIDDRYCDASLKPWVIEASDITVNNPACEEMQFEITGSPDNATLHATPYSYDGGVTWTASTLSPVHTGMNKTLEIRVRNADGNISSVSKVGTAEICLPDLEEVHCEINAGSLTYHYYKIDRINNQVWVKGNYGWSTMGVDMADTTDTLYPEWTLHPYLSGHNIRSIECNPMPAYPDRDISATATIRNSNGDLEYYIWGIFIAGGVHTPYFSAAGNLDYIGYSWGDHYGYKVPTKFDPNRSNNENNASIRLEKL